MPHKKGHTAWNKGLKCSEETKAKISKNHSRHFLGKHHSLEIRNKIAKAHIGRKATKETVEKMSLARKNNPNSGWFKKKHKYLGREKNINLRRKNEKKHLDSTYMHWTTEIKKRDSWKCRLLSSDCSGRLESHHIFNWEDYPELRYIVNNGITLCAFHHPRGREKEKRMIPIFQELLSVSKE